MIFICGEIKVLVSNSNKHCAYLEDPDDINLNAEFDGLNKDEVEDLKRKYVQVPCFFVLLTYDHAKVGNAATQLSGNSVDSSLTFR